CAGTFEDVAYVVEAVLDHARQIGVARTQACHRWWRLGHRLDVHLALPVRPVAVLDHHGDRSAHRHAVSHAGDDLDAVVLDLLASTPTVAALAARQVDVDVFGQYGQPGGQVLDEDRELRPVRLASSEYPQVAEAHAATRLRR